MALSEIELKLAHKHFKTYLKSQGIVKNNAKDHMECAITHVPQFIQRVKPEFKSLFDDDCSLEFLLGFIKLFESKDNWRNEYFGYIAQNTIMYYTQYRATCENIDLNSIIPLTIADPEKNVIDISTDEEDDILEGAGQDSLTRHYERSRRARQKCIEYYGCKCYACGLDFEVMYGDLGKDFIEVHHIIPVSSRNGEYKVDVIRDLRPLCSNCHSMVHRCKGTPFDVEELKHLIESRRDIR